MKKVRVVDMIREIIVVEGKDDISAVKKALDAEVIATGGFGYGESFLRKLKNISERRGVIILTDPDFAGEQIRKNISKDLKNCKHAFLPQGKAFKKNDIGVENASSQDIREAIKKARPIIEEKKILFTKEDLIGLGFIGQDNSRKRREIVGDYLGIGYCNSKQFLNRLNNFGISREEFVEALGELEEDIDG